MAGNLGEVQAPKSLNIAFSVEPAKTGEVRGYVQGGFKFAGENLGMALRF